jgi:FAD/FMN-containing dehydrogenase
MVERLKTQKALLRGWGRTNPTSAHLLRAISLRECEELLAEGHPRGLLARGAGRSYGDAAQNAGGLVLLLDAVASSIELAKDGSTVRAGAAVTLSELISLLVPRGLFLPVVPGTSKVTVGGAISADIHGKNHHRDSSFGAHIKAVEVLTPSGPLRAEPSTHPEVFNAVVGGMGLAGIITSAEIALVPIESEYVLVDTYKTADIGETMALMDSADHRYRYSVAWVDSTARGKHLGRSVVQFGNHPPEPLPHERFSIGLPPRLGSTLLRLTRPLPEGWPTDFDGIEWVPLALGEGLGRPPASPSAAHKSPGKNGRITRPAAASRPEITSDPEATSDPGTTYRREITSDPGITYRSDTTFEPGTHGAGSRTKADPASNIATTNKKRPPTAGGSLVLSAISGLGEAIASTSLVRPWTTWLFDRFWYRIAPKQETAAPIHFSKYFFPLDGISGWNRLYGKAGFVQYQLVIPFGSEPVIESALLCLAQARAFSPVTVLKRMGSESGFPLSFPMPGWTLALDLPAWIPGLPRLLRKLDCMVAEAGGRVYLAKDSRMSPDSFRSMYTRFSEWQKACERLDPGGVLMSDLARRLRLKGP